MFQQWNTWYLRSGQLTGAVEDYLLWHWFGPVHTHHLYIAYSVCCCLFLIVARIIRELFVFDIILAF